MKKVCLALMFVLIFAIPAIAEVVLPEASVNAQRPVAQTAAPITVTDIRKAVAKGLKSLTAKNGALTKISSRVDSAASEAKKASTAVQTMSTKLDGIATDAKDAKNGITDLSGKLLDKKEGEFAKLGAVVNNAASNSDHNLFLVGLWLTIVIVAVGMGTFWFLRRDVKQVGEKVDAVPADTASIILELEAPIVLTNVAGHTVTYTAPLIDGERRTPEVMPGLTGAFPDPSLIPRRFARRLPQMKKAIETIVTRYLNHEFDGPEHANQKAYLVHATRPGGELEIV